MGGGSHRGNSASLPSQFSFAAAQEGVQTSLNSLRLIQGLWCYVTAVLLPLPEEERLGFATVYLASFLGRIEKSHYKSVVKEILVRKVPGGLWRTSRPLEMAPAFSHLTPSGFAIPPAKYCHLQKEPLNLPIWQRWENAVRREGPSHLYSLRSQEGSVPFTSFPLNPRILGSRKPAASSHLCLIRLIRPGAALDWHPRRPTSAPSPWLHSLPPAGLPM